MGRPAAVALMAADGETAFTSLKRETASSGDMVFSLGEARDQHDGAERLRYYARIWQRRPEGWRIVFDDRAEARAIGQSQVGRDLDTNCTALYGQVG
ncbi:MAG: hypothetical protein ACT4OF_16315 [Caulobacteraceae bacterium]